MVCSLDVDLVDALLDGRDDPGSGRGFLRQ